VKKIELYLKPLAQLAFTVLSAILVLLVDHDHLSNVDWVNITITGLGSVMVLGAGNLPEGLWAHTKTYVSAAMAALVTLNSILITGANLDSANWIEIILAFLAALGVYKVKGPTVVPAPVEPSGRGKHEAGI
jgi:hypothetical protein